MTQHSAHEILILGAADVFRILTMESCIEAVDRVMRRVSLGGARLPLRNVLTLPSGPNVFAAMPGCLDDPLAVGAKLVAVFPEMRRRARSSHNGAVVLLDPDSGQTGCSDGCERDHRDSYCRATAAATRARAERASTLIADSAQANRPPRISKR